MNKYYLELPENYKLDKTIDIKKISTNIFLNVLNILFVIISFLILIPLKFNEIKLEDIKELSYRIFLFVLIQIILDYYMILNQYNLNF